MMHEHERHRGSIRSGPSGIPIVSASQKTSTNFKETPGLKREAPAGLSEVVSPKLPKTGSTATCIREAISQATKSSPRPFTPSQANTTMVGDKRKTSPNSASAKKRVLSGITVHDAAKVVTDKDLFFFEKVKRILPDPVYANFLKCLTLFNDEIVSKTEVINLVSPMIGKSPDLFHELHRILGRVKNKKFSS